MNNKVKVCLDQQIFFSKPTEEHARQLSNRIGRFTKQLSKTDIRSFALDVSLDGRTFCPATFNNHKRNKENFEQQQLFPLDFDNKDPNNRITSKEALARAEQLGFQPLFGYKTLSSSTENEKFRLVFINDVPITDRIVAEAMSKSLGIIYPEADQSCCKDVSKMYYGGKELLFYNEKEETIDIDSVFRNLSYCLKEKYNGNHYRDKIAKFSRETGIALNLNGLLDVTVTEVPTEQFGASLSNQEGKKSPSPIIYSLYNRIANGEIFPTKQYRINLSEESSTSNLRSPKRPLKNHKAHRSDILDQISPKCQLFHKFAEGQAKLRHDELFGIATNLIHVDSGSRRFLDVLSEHSHFYGEKFSKWEHDLGYMTQQNYQPRSCDNFCPYSS